MDCSEFKNYVKYNSKLLKAVKYIVKFIFLCPGKCPLFYINCPGFVLEFLSIYA